MLAVFLFAYVAQMRESRKHRAESMRLKGLLNRLYGPIGGPRRAALPPMLDVEVVEEVSMRPIDVERGFRHMTLPKYRAVRDAAHGRRP